MSDKNSIETIISFYEEAKKAEKCKKALEDIKNIYSARIKSITENPFFRAEAKALGVFSDNPAIKKNIEIKLTSEEIERIYEITIKALKIE